MNVKRTLVTAVVRMLSENTSLIQKPDAFSEFLTVVFDGKTHEQQVAEKFEVELDRVLAGAKSLKTRHAFNKITKNI